MSELCGLSVLLCFCVSVFRVSMNSSERREPQSPISAVAYRRAEDAVPSTTVTSGLPGRDRALPLIHSSQHERELSDSNTAQHERELSDSNTAQHERELSDSNTAQHERELSDSNTAHLGKRTAHEGRGVNFQSELVDNHLQLTHMRQPRLTTLYRGRTSTMVGTYESLSVNMFSAVPKQSNSRAHVSTSNMISEQTREHPGSSVSFFHDKGQEVKSDLNTSEIQLKRLPKAIIIGAKKAGTRALLEILRMHPFVEGTGPEPHFFDRNYEKGLEWYRDLMPFTQSHQITIEKTPGYFVTRSAPKRIFEMDPYIKLILVVRDPVTRAISDYCQAVSKRPMKSFEEMALLNNQLGRVNISWGAIRIGVYAKHMEYWLRLFSLKQIHLVDAQTLIQEPANEVSKVESFLGLPRYLNASHFLLRGYKDRFPCLVKEGKSHCLSVKTKGRDHPVVKESVLQRLRDFYRPLNAKFYHMVRRHFHWS